MLEVMCPQQTQQLQGLVISSKPFKQLLGSAMGLGCFP